MSKFEKFKSASTSSDFSVREAIAFSVEEDPQRIGRTAMTNVARIELSQIIAKEQVRTKYDSVKHEEMKASLAAHGQQQPIVVYWSAEDNKYVVFVGHRRHRAASEVGSIESLEAVILKEAPTEAERVEKQLVENLVREELNAVDEARAYADIMRVRGCTAKDLAKDLGRAASTIQRSVKMLELPEDILDEVASGTIPKSVVREVQKLATENEQRVTLNAYKSGVSYKKIAEEVTKKPGLRTTDKQPGKSSGTKKVFTSGGLKLQATANKRIPNGEVIEAIESWLEKLKGDRRGKRAA